jgi:anionic cell wall polymer biosynthesis LytR-Cps2A-Psr (LCP) family protein
MALSIDISSRDIKPSGSSISLPRRPHISMPNDPNDPKKAKKKGLFKKLVGLVALVVILSCGFYAFRFFQLADTIGIKIKPEDILNPIKKNPELKKDSTGTYTAALLVGIDTRGEGSKLQNTDTIMVATYNHKTKNTAMISIPRDFHAEVPGQPGYFNKINGIYAKAEAIEDGHGL